MKKLFLVNLILIWLVPDVMAQHIVSGKVFDSTNNNEPLPGVTIIVKTTTNGTTTDMNGSYSLEVPNGNSVLVFSFIGFESQEIQVGNRSEIEVHLANYSTTLSEVVVVGYGEVKKSDLTGSVSSISNEDLQEVAITSLDQALQGRAAGVQVTQASGQPGGVATVRIRGGNSIQGGNEPLYVIDGFPIYNGGGFEVEGTGANINGLSSLNPNDIESIEILKDASATAIYGSRGANGVVLITTKSGKRGQDILTFESYYGIQGVRKTIDVLDAVQFGELVNEAYTNDGLAPVFTQEEIGSFGKGTNWQDEIFRSSPIQNYQLTFSGGDEKSTYSVSGGYLDQQGIVINSYFKRFSGRVNLDRRINPNFNVGTHLTVNRSNANLVKTASNGGGDSDVILAALMMSPIMEVYEDEKLGIYNQVNDRGILLPNPVATALEIDNETIITRILGDFYSEYEIIDGLKAKVSFGADLIHNKGNYYIPSYIYQGTGSNGYGHVSSLFSTTWLNENTVSYNKQINSMHSVGAVAGITFQGNRTEYVSASSENFVTDALAENNLQSGAIYNAPMTRTPEWGLMSYLGRVNYNFSEKYLFTLTGRIDGSSRFGNGNKYGFFPSGAIAWRIVEEDFIQSMNFFDDLKLRASYGVTGNQEIGYYNSLATLAPDNYTIGETLVTGFHADRVSNPNLEWEKTGQLDIGVDIGIWNGKLRLTADYYYKKTTDLLYSAPIPWTSGFSTALQNIGSMENRGVEFSLGADLISRDLTWTTNFNIAFNRNKVLDLGDIDFFLAGGNSAHLKVADVSRVEVGQPIGSFYGYVFDGIFQNIEEIEQGSQPGAKPGDIRYRDLNNDGSITPQDRTIIGKAQPRHFGGWTNSFGYKGFELNIFAQWSYGNDILNYNRFELEMPSGGQNVSAELLNRWTVENPSDIHPRATRNRTILFSDKQLEDGSFLRIKTLTFAYTFPDLVSEKFGGLKLYVTAQNILTLTNYSGFDPEVSRYGATNLNLGEDFGVYPVAKSFMVGVNVNLK